MAEGDEPQEKECTFRWDENSQLYYHASTGFYHDPQAGWYYSSRDGLYYKFEDGNYVLLQGYQAEDQSEIHDDNYQGETIEAQIQGREVSVEPSLDSSALDSSNQPEYPPPPSEWLEDTLIDMFLSGYSNQTTCAADSGLTVPVESDEMTAQYTLEHGVTMPVESDEMTAQYALEHGDEDEELEEGEWIPDDPDFWGKLSERNFDEGMSTNLSQEEENWRAQYGQASQVDEEWMSDLQVVDLWDWVLVKGTKKDGKTEMARLVGRLRKRSAKLHPSVPSGGGILKTAPVCDTHLNLVRVSSGRIYRLRIPSMQYLASTAVYDASNPTRDWGFPPLSVKSLKKKPKYDQQPESQRLEGLDMDKTLSSAKKLCTSKKDHTYRDRAAERRALHRGFGIGPGQKTPLNNDDSIIPSSPPMQPEEAAAESMNMSFGEGSYARKILEGMGWKEGESLGHSMKGLTKPLQATGNKGTAGLGWNDNSRRK